MTYKIQIDDQVRNATKDEAAYLDELAASQTEQPKPVTPTE